MPNEDFQQRRDSFIKEYGELQSKYQVDFLAIPSFVPNERGSWDLIVSVDIVDKKDAIIKSPIQP